ncbi:hypothetical protein [Paracoccus ravus]|uniref:hypothetical protein n=1 Tax=Paracoccus ravus TaxID=2447760 RepID=UPI00106EDCC9|nr:hypothetical protein [Paracoccus ravus]
MSDTTETIAPATADLAAMVEQTHPAALRLLDDKALAAILRDLRKMKAAETEQKMQKVLGQAIRRAAAEKQERAAPAEDAPETAPETSDKPGKSERIEAKRLKEAEKAEKKRVKDAERSERKAAKHAERDRIKAEKQSLKAQSKAKQKPA